MKKTLCCIVLLISGQNAYADITLEFNDLLNPDREYSIRYNISNDQLKFSESGSKRVNIYQKTSRQFISHDPNTNTSSMVNEEVLAKRVQQLTKVRLQKLKDVEKSLQNKLQTMTPDEQKVGESLINLLKYPDIYGEHTLLSIRDTQKHKKINTVDCQVFQLYRKAGLLKEYCLAQPRALGMSQDEYQTLRSFYAFDYNMQTQLSIAMGQTRFSLIDFDKEKMPGVIIETLRYENSEPVQHLILKSFEKSSVKNKS